MTGWLARAGPFVVLAALAPGFIPSGTSEASATTWHVRMVGEPLVLEPDDPHILVCQAGPIEPVAGVPMPRPLVDRVRGCYFAPEVLTLGVGDSVVWTNVALTTSHSAVTAGGGDPGFFDIGAKGPGESSEPITFTIPGTYNYRCSVHGVRMTPAMLIVEP